MTPLALEAGDNPSCHNVVLAQAVCTRAGSRREPSRLARPSPCSPASSLGHAALPKCPPHGQRTGNLDRCLAPQASTEPAAANSTARSCAIDVRDARAYSDEEATTAPNRSRPDSAGRLVIAREAAAVSIHAQVRRLRRLGASWPQLAAALGVSRQATRQRYGP